MALTPLRWIAALIAGCLVAGVAVLRESPPRGRESSVGRQLADRTDRLGGHASNAAERLRLAQLRDSLRAVVGQPANPDSIRVFRDGALPSEYSMVLDSLAWHSVRPVRDAGLMGIDIVFLYDTVKSVRGGQVSKWYGARADYVLPLRADDRCMVMVHVQHALDTRHRPFARWRSDGTAERLVGPCAFYRVFGMPGARVDQWLRTRGWSFANAGSWSDGARPIDLMSRADWADYSPFTVALYTNNSLPFFGALSADGVQCVAAQLQACSRAVLERRGVTGPLVVDGNVLLHSYPSSDWGGWGGWEGWGGRNRAFGVREYSLMADMVRTVGRDRFARFWTSADPVPAAFEKATGEPLDRWTARWAVSQYGRVPGLGAGVSSSAGALSVGVIVLALLLTVRAGSRRQFA